MKRILVLVLAFALVGSIMAVAGEKSADSGGLSKYVRVTYYDVKPGAQDGFTSLVRQVRQSAIESGAAEFRWIAATADSGNAGEVSIVAGYNSFAEMEQVQNASRKAFQTVMLKNASFGREVAEAHKGAKSVIAKLREDLSYNPQRLASADITRWEVTLLRFKPGAVREFIEAEKESIEYHKKANIDEHWVVYQIEYGTPGPAFYVVRGLRSLADLDVDLSEAHKNALPKSLRTRFEGAVRDAMLYEETRLWNVRPDLSRPEDALVAANPSFWTVKEQEPAVAAKGKKKSSVQPASIKKEDKP